METIKKEKDIKKLFGYTFYPLDCSLEENKKEKEKYHDTLASGIDNYADTHDTKKGYIVSMESKIKACKDSKEIAKLFCKMIIDDQNSDYKNSGVYLWYYKDDLIYIGEAENIYERFKNGYGNISPRNIFYGGQSTNCKMNYVMAHAKIKPKIYYMVCSNPDKRKDIEKELLKRVREENEKNSKPVFMLYNYRGNKKEYRRDNLDL